MVMEDFNLLISTSKGNENNACSEIWFLLGELGDREALVDRTEVAGLVVAKTKLNPFEVIEGLRRILRDRPWEFRYILKVVPIEVVVKTRLDEIKRATSALHHKILENETFRVTVEKRHTVMSTKDIIEAAVENLNRKVDLNNPDKIILIEVLGRLTGISVIKPQNILSVTKEKPSHT
ncbi:MAG: THUMP domain-containing protein [Candidatus Bathyarchaeota archaeon]|nr:THUMP domain-containing protein [Candidatus Bathyarchaeota archaeon]